MQRKILSLITLFSFLGLITTSVALYTWSFSGLGKKFWTEIHITGGLLFIAAGVWHMLLNAKPMVRYMGATGKTDIKRFSPLIIALALIGALYTATVLQISPAAQLLSLSDLFKEKYVANAPAKKQPALTVQAFCDETGLENNAAIDKLHKATGLSQLSPQNSFASLSQQSGIPVRKLLTILAQPDKDAGE